MKKTIMTGLIAVVFLGLSTAAQDWYHDRDARYRGDRWRSHVFAEIRYRFGPHLECESGGRQGT
jgi:hypothetical protein